MGAIQSNTRVDESEKETDRQTETAREREMCIEKQAVNAMYIHWEIAWNRLGEESKREQRDRMMWETSKRLLGNHRKNARRLECNLYSL